MSRRSCWLALSLAGTAVCIGPGALLGPATPHAAYVVMLQRSGLADSVEAAAWLRAAEAVLIDAPAVALPVRRGHDLRPDASYARAIGLRVSVPRGRRLSVAVDFEALPSLFVDLFRLDANAEPRRVASLAAGRRSFLHAVDEAGDYVIRVQSEVAAAGRATIAVRTLASLPFPIAGADARMQSGFGVARDAGRRQHQGIDIFAPRGTPVRAVTAGIARAGSNRLGGTVVWLYAPGAGRTFYYAHLDRHAVGAMAFVRAGDVLGYVGNTGNARTTPPHLHFGLYEHGAVDPWPFVQPDQPIPRDVSTPPTRRRKAPGARERPAPPARPISSRARPRRRSDRRRRT